MAVNPDIVGREYPPDGVYEVSREKIAEFATAIGSDDPAHFDPEHARALGHAGIIAPPTFAVGIAQRSEARVVRDPGAGIDYSRVVHGEEKFVHHRPITVGDVLVTTSYVDAVRTAGGHSMVSTRSEISTQDGEKVTTVTSTIVVRGGE